MLQMESVVSQRIYKYDNVKAILIFLVVIGHMSSDYVSDCLPIRGITLWIYTFHMPAFIFLSGLVHKQYITQERAGLGCKGELHMRWEKALGFFLCGWALKIFIFLTRTLMGQNPFWNWLGEPGIPWYLFVLAAYEILFFLMRKIDGKVKPRYIILGAFALSAVFGYLPFVGDVLCLSRLINFLPIYALGYYMDMKKFLPIIEKNVYRILGGLFLLLSLLFCTLGPFGIYNLRKWFTGRRSYEFLSQFFPLTEPLGWLYRLLIWGIAMILVFSLIAVVPNKDFKFFTKMGSRTLNVYFWHRPLCYLFRTLAVLPNLFVLFGGTYQTEKAGTLPGLAFQGSAWSMAGAVFVYLLIGAAMTLLFSLKIFEHPCSDIMKLSNKLVSFIRSSHTS